MNLNNLGLAKAARAIITGEDKVVEKLKQHKLHLILLAKDSGSSTTKKIKDKASFYGVRVNCELTSQELSQAIGEINIHVIGIYNEGFAKLIEK